MDVVAVRGLTKTYPTFTLDTVSFSLGAGRITGFIGRNGAGKTTTIKSMLNLVHPDAGEIEYFGIPLASNEAQVKARIGYSTGTISWYPRKRIRVIKDIEKRFYDTWDEAAYKRYLRLFALDENKCPRELSEGMKVKCNLLLALSHGAEVLILDEPTSGLDPFSRDELLELFDHIKQTGVAIFFSTHIISDIEKCADDIVYLSQGRVVAALPKEEFTRRYQNAEESFEETFLRLERGASHA
ncbi:MAG: ABC transporter ATP-binding protein [Coriobacteriales bacterium]|nr:ABC transporter ATP-binding protein [Coriobacteriales bacterium]